MTFFLLTFCFLLFTFYMLGFFFLLCDLPLYLLTFVFPFNFHLFTSSSFYLFFTSLPFLNPFFWLSYHVTVLPSTFLPLPLSHCVTLLYTSLLAGCLPSAQRNGWANKLNLDAKFRSCMVRHEVDINMELRRPRQKILTGDKHMDVFRNRKKYAVVKAINRTRKS